MQKVLSLDLSGRSGESARTLNFCSGSEGRGLRKQNQALSVVVWLGSGLWGRLGVMVRALKGRPGSRCLYWVCAK